MSHYRAALISAGAIAEAHASAVQALASRIQIVAVMDTNVERGSIQPGDPFYNSISGQVTSS